MVAGSVSTAVESFLSYMGGDDGFWALGAVYFGMIGGEWLYYRLRRPGRYDVKDAANNVLVNLINIAFDTTTSFVAPMVLYYWIWEHARLIPHLGLWVAIPLSFVGHEIAYYIDHRLGHRVGLFWAFHQVHHSSNEFNFTVAARGFLIDGNIVLFLCVLPLAWLGVPPLVFLGVHALKSIYGIFNHSDWVPKLGILEEFMATPANHRAHHGTQDKYIDRNYSQVTVILDRLLGTFQREEERANLGLVTPFHDRSPIATQLSGLKWLRNRMRTADRWQDKLKYLWKPPEWTHDAVSRQGSEFVAAE